MDEIKFLWPPPPASRLLNDDEVHAWAINLNPPAAEIAACEGTLATDELERARRFRFERHQRRFLVARGSLRKILSSYLDRNPSELTFSYSPRGKPALAGLDEHTGLFFNLSHSDELAILAVTRICPLGVDVERVRPLSDGPGIARRFFSARESRGLDALPEPEKPAAFFNLWTRKEAWLKATGDGLVDSLDKVEVSFLAGDSPRLINLPAVSGSIHEWTLIDLRPAEQFAAALALRHRHVRMSRWIWC